MRTRQRAISAMLAAITITAAGLMSGGGAQAAAWPVCTFRVTTDNVPIYAETALPPSGGQVDTANEGDIFENPSNRRWTSPTGVQWRNGYVDDAASPYGWIERQYLVKIGGINCIA